MTNSSYWKQRLAEEEAWQAKQIEADTDFDKLIETRYRNVINDIEDLIDREVSRLSEKTGTNYSQMMTQVTTGDIERYEKEAKELVKQAEGMRKSGKKVSYKDFTDEENLRMKIYNATMRINRLEYLKSMTGVYLTHVTMDISDDLRKKLTNEVIAEQKRQAGLLGKFLPDYDFKASYSTQSIVMQSMAGANWSQRLWRSQDTLKASLDRVLTTGFVTGEHPRVLARKLKDQVASTVKNSTYVTERLARTESARVQYDVQYKGIKDNGFKQAWYFAERRACKICQAFADKKTPGEEDGVYDLEDVPRIPMDTHPNCRCSISSYIGESVIDELANNKNLQSTYLNERMAKTLGPKHSEEIAKTLDKAPDTIKKFWTKFKDKLKIVDWQKGKGTDAYNPLKGGVTFYEKSFNWDDDPTYYTKKNDVFFHELGHMLDHISAPMAPTFFEDLQKTISKPLVKYIDEDWDDLVNSRYQDIVKNLKFSEFRDGKGQVEGKPGRWVRVKKDGTPTVATLKQLKAEAKYDIISDMNQELKDVSLQEKGDISDVLSGLGNGYALNVGHSASYWERGGDRARGSEAFAELTSAMINNPGSAKLFKKYFPKTVAKYYEILEGVLKNG